jgi:hypothetical protein
MKGTFKVCLLALIILILVSMPILAKKPIGVEYEIYNIKDMSYSSAKRYKVSVTIKGEPTPKELKKICRIVKDKIKDKHSFNAITIGMYDYKEFVSSGGHALGSVDYAPYGEWGKANKISTGEYSKMEFKWNIKEKDWSKQLTEREAKIYGYFANLLWNSNLKESVIKTKTANEFDISEKRVKEIYDKQTIWIYMDKKD